MLLPQALLQPAVTGKDRHLILLNTTMRCSLCLIESSNSFTHANFATSTLLQQKQIKTECQKRKQVPVNVSLRHAQVSRLYCKDLVCWDSCFARYRYQAAPKAAQRMFLDSYFAISKVASKASV